jgi:hypothetical protein
MAQQTFSGVPGAFSAGEVLSSADQNLIRDLMIAVIKEGMTGDTGEILPMIMDLTNNRIVLDTGGLEFSNGSLQTVAGLTVAGGTLTGELDFDDNLATKPMLKDYSELNVAANSSTALTIDLTAGNVHTVAMTGNCTFTFSNPIADDDCSSFTLILTQDGSGSRTATWPASVDWPGGSAPTLTTTATTGRDMLMFVTVDGGVVWLGSSLLDFS